MLKTSETIGALGKALAAAQAEIGGAKKGKVNPAFKSKYADLASVWDAWQAVGPAQGLSVVQFPGAFSDGKAHVTSMLMHESGEWLRETLEIPATKQDAQGCGSAITYARRFALAAIVGIAPEDDDGNGAVRRAPERHDDVPALVSAWPEGPFSAKTGLMQAYRAFVHNLHGAADADTVEALIDEAKLMLSQFRAAARAGILTAEFEGQGDFKGVAETLADARHRVKQRAEFPADPGDTVEEAESTKLLRRTLEDCGTPAALDKWAQTHADLIAEQTEELRDELRERLKARKREMPRKANVMEAG